jgi:hypothetical protein
MVAMTEPKIPDFLDKPSGCIHINHIVSGPAMRLYNCFLAWTFDDIPLVDEVHRFTVPRKIVEEYMHTRNDAAIKGWLRELGDASVEWNNLGGLGHGKGSMPNWGYYKFIQEPELVGSFVTFTMARTLRGFIADSTMFARINLLIERRFKKTKYALPLYELGLDYRDNKDKVSGKGCTPWLSVDQLRKYLGVADKYPEFKLLNRAILQNALKEIQAEADITMTMEKKTDKRVVTHVRFLIEDDPTHMSAREKIRRTMATLPGMGDKNQIEILKFAQAMHNAFGVSLPRARKIARLYIGHEPELRAVMEKIQHDKLAGKVKGKLGAYAAAVLEEENPVVKIKKIPHIE